jgi:hypothetical protein
VVGRIGEASGKTSSGARPRMLQGPQTRHNNKM